VILAGDVGATKILLEVGEARSEGWKPAFARRMPAEGVANFPAVLAGFLKEWEAEKPARARISAAGFGVAGPAIGNKVKMTHRPLAVDGDALADRFKIARVTVMNDLAAAAHGLEWLGPKDFVTLQPGKGTPGDPRVLLGVGTGLGVSYIVPHGDEKVVVPSEGGHIGFSPASAEQAELLGALLQRHGRVEAEDVASGVGLSNIYDFVQHRRGLPVEREDRRAPEWITEGAATRRDPACIEALGLFAECVGNIAGDHGLALVARGGVFLAGGVMAKIAPSIDTARFRAAFCAKGAFSYRLMRVPVRAVVNERLVLFGAARAALL
jgi:glucokinase